jgi:hypothetical protein
MEKGISEMNDLPLIKCPDDVAIIWRKGISPYFNNSVVVFLYRVL